jgi:pimeloyl-ACP methyl ester carboxylesterase
METTETHRMGTDEGFTHRTLDVGEVKLHVVEAGPESGPLVVLLHGFPEFWWSWRHQMRALADAGFHAVAPDMRGYNLSDKPKGVKAYRFAKLTGDVAGLIHALRRERAVIVGHDWGGAVAWGFAMDHPEMTERLIVMNCPHPLMMERGLRTRKQMKKSWYMFFFQLPVLPERFMKRDDWAFLRRTFAKDGMSNDEIHRYVEAMGREGAATASINYYRAAIRSIATRTGPKPARITAPTLVIWGERDRYLGRELATPPAKWVESARVVFVPEATHWVQRDAAPRVNELLLEQIADLRSGARG